MLTYQQARRIAESEIQDWRSPNDPDDRLVIVGSDIIEKPYAWIFPYTSQKWLLTGDIRYAIAGNAPLFIDKLDGRISTFRTGLSREGMIDEYEEQNKIWRLTVTTPIQHDTPKQLHLKSILNLSLEELAALKAQTHPIITRGSRHRLERLATKLKTNGIDTNIELAIKIP